MLSEIDTRPFPTAPPAFNLAGHVLAWGRKLGDKPALVHVGADGDETLGYASLLRLVQGTAGALLSSGLAPGERVLLRLGSGPAFPVAFLGAIWAGLVPVPASAALTVTEITRLATLVAPKLVLADEGISLPIADIGVLPADLGRWATSQTAPLHLGDPDREAYVIFTSGTSGNPMAVSHAHRAILARQTMHSAWEGLEPTDRLLHAGAMNWTYTLGTGLLDPWTVGATALVAKAGTKGDALAAMLLRMDATIFAASPGVYRQMLRGDMASLPRLRHGLSAGETLPRSLRDLWLARTGTDLHEALGMSEVSTYVSGSPGRPAPPGTAGFVQPGRHVAILGDDGNPVMRGDAGELAVSTADPGLMRGYLGQPAQTGQWFRTGDVASMDLDGAITHLGRKDDLLNAGGFRVSPAEVEAAFEAFPGLNASAAVDVEPAPGTRIIALFYEAASDLDQGALQAHAEMSLARWKQPRHYQRIAILPRSGTGKIIRRGLARSYGRDAQ